jgi:hypothetical protein
MERMTNWEVETPRKGRVTIRLEGQFMSFRIVLPADQAHELGKDIVREAELAGARARN